jgi:hypothetical protein
MNWKKLGEETKMALLSPTRASRCCAIGDTEEANSGCGWVLTSSKRQRVSSQSLP